MVLDDPHILSFVTLAAFTDLKLNGLALFEGSIARPFDIRVVNEDIFSAFSRDESEALLSIEELHCSLWH
tara:strand:+ start:377 stop:586 length:210 start_codon:yes stop_codon:yes gene_type:complete